VALWATVDTNNSSQFWKCKDNKDCLQSRQDLVDGGRCATLNAAFISTAVQ